MVASRKDAKARRENSHGEWKTIPLRYVCQLSPSVRFDGLEEDDELTFLPMDRVKSGYFIPNTDKFSKYASSYNVFEEGDIVLAKVTPCFENGNIAIAERLEGGKGYGSSELFVIRPKEVNRKFLFYYFQSSAFKQEGEASMTGAGGLKRVSPDLLRQHHLPCPEEETQRLIADYLDRETARIDALVAEKEKMLALLEEKRTAIISRAVTRGLDPNAPLKPSGLDWLGDIPAHWESRPIKFCLAQKKDAVKTGPFGSQLVASEMDQGTIKVYNQKNVIQQDLYSGDNYITVNKFEELKAFSVFPCDILITTRGTIGRCVIVPDDAEVGILHPCLMRIQVNSGVVLPEYLALLIQDGHIVLLQLKIMSNATTIEVIYSESLNSVIIPVPTIDEQKKILEKITSGNNVVNKAITEVRDSVNLLKERRAALITAAVTGQIPIEEMCP